jgi:hypothetical protein
MVWVCQIILDIYNNNPATTLADLQSKYQNAVPHYSPNPSLLTPKYVLVNVEWGWLLCIEGTTTQSSTGKVILVAGRAYNEA